MEKTNEELIQEIEDMPSTKLARKYGHLTFGDIYNELEAKADLQTRLSDCQRELAAAREVVKHAKRLATTHCFDPGDPIWAALAAYDKVKETKQ